MMDVQTLQTFFLWCSAINLSLMVLAAIFILSAKEWVYKTHSRWLNIPRDTFDSILYVFFGICTMLIFIFCIIPWIVLSIIA